MITKIRHAIQRILDDNFQGIEIETQEIEQDFNTPCFKIRTLSSNSDKEIDNRYNQKVLFNIAYFSDKERVAEDLEQVGTTLFDLLENIEIEKGIGIRSKDRRMETVDGVLHFFLSFDIKLLKQKLLVNKMENVNIQGGLKHGKGSRSN